MKYCLYIALLFSLPIFASAKPISDGGCGTYDEYLDQYANNDTPFYRMKDKTADKYIPGFNQYKNAWKDCLKREKEAEQPADEERGPANYYCEGIGRLGKGCPRADADDGSFQKADSGEEPEDSEYKENPSDDDTTST